MINCIVIDDNQDIANVFSDLLELFGINVIATGNDGLQAVKLYEKYRPEIIFIDMLMPKYDGFYAIKNIQKIDPNSKIIVVTGDITMNESLLLDSYNITALIFKPFNINKVKRAISHACLQM